MKLEKCKVLVLGATGMLGNAVFRVLAESGDYIVYGTTRGAIPSEFQEILKHADLIRGIDIEKIDVATSLLADLRPDVVINCIGLVKQRAESNNPLTVLPVNSLLPHRLASLCSLINARLIHFSTDCVFSGSQGMYIETDEPNATDLYGRSKLLGEVDYPNAVTLRTSIIGHEISSSTSLVGWFLAQQGQVNGFTQAIFSGLPTVEMALLLRDYVLPNPELRGLYHVSAAPIDKFSLISLISSVYNKSIEILPDDKLVIDRSLDSTRFRAITGYNPPSWSELIKAMHAFG